MPLAHILVPQLLKRAQDIESELGHAPVGYLDQPAPQHPVFGDVAGKTEYQRSIDESQRNGRGSFQRGFEDGTAIYRGDLANDPAYVNDPQVWTPAPQHSRGAPANYQRGSSNSKSYLEPAAPAAVPAAAAPAGGRIIRAGYEKTPFDPKGILDKKDTTSFDPNDPSIGGGMQRAMGAFQRSGDPRQQAFSRGFLAAEGGLDVGSHVKPIPSGPIAAQPEPAKKNKRGKAVISAKPGEPVAVNERGEAIDIKGKNLGYLNAPAQITPAGDIPLRTAERTPNDIIMGQKPGSLEQTDPFAVTSLEQKYGKHYHASDVDRYGIPNLKFPEGYFKGKTKAEKEDILNGVKALAALQRGTRV